MLPAGMDAYLSLLKPRGVMACVGLPEKKAANMTSLFMHSLVCSEKSLVGCVMCA
jgi:D-arabinose 1-dehydrogenase-like Zn-dependent alcohol dehydrogenase